VLLWSAGGLLAQTGGPKLEPVMTTAGAPLTTDAFAEALPSAWKAGKGTWVAKDGLLRGTELAADKHVAVVRRTLGFKDAVITFSFRLDQARSISLSINDAKGHVCRLIVDPLGFSIRKDDHDHEGPDKAVIFAKVPMTLAKDEWHTAVVELSGPELVAQIDRADKVAFGKHALLDGPKANFGFTVAGGPAEFRDIRIVGAKPRADWAATKQRLGAVKGK
jgi:hypothetical protein